MATLVKMTQVSPTMKEGTLVEWQKEIGEMVHAGDILASVETDKAVMDLEAFDEGILVEKLVKEKETVPVGAPIAILAESSEEKEKIEELKQQALAELQSLQQKPIEGEKEDKQQEVPSSEVKKQEQDYSTEPEVLPTKKESGRIKASPLARKIAKEKGIDLSLVQGTGPGGRIVKRDVESFVPHATRSIMRKPDVEKPLSGMRKAIASRLAYSKSNVPHFYLHKDVRIDKLEALRKTMNQDRLYFEQEKKISLNDWIVKASAMALRDFPTVNASWTESQSILLRGNVDVGVAVALEDGLITPVVRNADQKSLVEISTEIRHLAKRARERKLKPDEYTGGSFTVSNLGMYGIDFFEAIINAPEAALLAVGSANIKPVWNQEKREFVPATILTLTLSCDHRVVDGALGAEFLSRIAEYLEHPGILL